MNPYTERRLDSAIAEARREVEFNPLIGETPADRLHRWERALEATCPAALMPAALRRVRAYIAGLDYTRPGESL